MWMTLAGPAAEAAGTAGCKHWVPTPDETARGVPVPSPAYRCPTIASRIAWESNQLRAAGLQEAAGIGTALAATNAQVWTAATSVFDGALDRGERISHAITLLLVAVAVIVVLGLFLYVFGPLLPAFRSWVAS